MTEYYENGPEGMPRVERMTRSTIMAVLSQKDVPTIYVSREEDYNSLCKFAHAVAEETLARVPAWPAERTTAPISLTDEKIEALAVKHESFGFGQAGKKSKLSIHGFEPEGLREFARALLAAAPVPIQQVPTAWCTDAHFEAWCERHDMRKDRSDHRQMFDDAASLYLTVSATPPALAGSQVQAAGDAVDAARYRWLRDQDIHSQVGRFTPYAVQVIQGQVNKMLDGKELDAACDAAIREQQT